MNQKHNSCKTISQTQRRALLAGLFTLLAITGQAGFAMNQGTQTVLNQIIRDNSTIKTDMLLQKAVRNGNMQLAKLYLNNDANPAVLDANQNNLLHLIRALKSTQDQIELAEILLKKAPQLLNAVNGDGQTPLSIATALFLNPKFIEFLKNKGAQ
jgi:ankyrin repeat protein